MIAILTNFSSFDPTYSLTTIVQSQYRMLSKHGYDPVLITSKGFRPEGYNVRDCLPSFVLHDYRVGEALRPEEDKVEEIRVALEENLKDCSAVIAHDFILQGWFYPYNLAWRKVNLPIKWLHEIHSVPSRALIQGLPDNASIIYPTHPDQLKVAEVFGTWTDKVKVVNHPKDFSWFNLGEECRQLLENVDIYKYEYIQTYPFCSTRMDMKGVQKAIRLLGKMGNTLFIALNTNSGAEKEQIAIRNMKEYAKSVGVDTVWASDYGKQGVSQQTVKECFQISDVFISPTMSETYSLAVIEAALCRNLLVLNKDVPAMDEISGFDALFPEFGAIGITHTYQDENKWYSDWAKIIKRELSQNKNLNAFRRIRKQFNEDAIFHNQLEPLIV